MNFGEAVKSGVQGWVDFRGRASRSQFWWFQLFLVLVFFGYLIVLAALYALADAEPSDEAANVIVVLYFLVIFLPALSIQIRRLRDAGLGWGFIFLSLVPFLGALALIVMYLLPSKGVAAPMTAPPAQETVDATVAAEPPVSGAGGSSEASETVSRIERLADLHREGRITDQQFETAKRKVLGE